VNGRSRGLRRRACLALGLPLGALALPFLSAAATFPGQDFRDYFGPHARFARETLRETGELPRWNPRQYAGVPFEGTAQNNHRYPPNLLLLLMDEWTAWEILVLLHLVLAASGAYRLARCRRLGRDAAVLAGLAFSLSLPVVGRAALGHLPNFEGLCLTPWLLYRFFRLQQRPDAARGLGAALAFWLLLVGGSPQFIVHAVLLGLAWTLHRRPSAGGAFPVAGAALLGLAAAGPHLAAILHVAAESNRGDPAVQAILTSHHDYGWRDLLGSLSFLPSVPAESWLREEKVQYAGLLPLLLAPFAWKGPRRRDAAFWTLVAAVVLGEALTGFLSRLLPPLGAFRIPERILWLLPLALGQLAALGGSAIGARPSRAAWAAAFLAVDLLTAQAFRLRPLGPDQLRPPPAYLSALGEPIRDHRLLDLTGWKAGPLGHGVRLLRGYGHPVPPALSRLYARAGEDVRPEIESLPHVGRWTDPGILRDLNVRWILSPEDRPPPDNWVRRLDLDGKILWEAPVAPREAWFAAGGGTLALTRPSPHRIELAFEAGSDAEIVVAEDAWPGWSASVDGVPVPLERHRGVLMRLKVPRGPGRAALVYRTPIPAWVEGLRGLALAAALTAALGAAFRNRRGAPMKG
jgi:hypothetical protein